jgi:hypothetical protein
MTEPEIVFTDRYGDGPRPDPETMCKGQCEGTGFVPISEDETEPKWKALSDEAHAKPHPEPCDGTHFVRCPDCGGTGLLSHGR